MNESKSTADTCSDAGPSQPSFSTLSQSQQRNDGKRAPPMTPTMQTNDIPFYNYRKRIFRKGSMHHLSRRSRSKITSSPSLPQSKPDLPSTGTPEISETERKLIESSRSKPNDDSRVSPTSIVDFNHAEFLSNSSHMNDKNDVHISSSTSLSFDYDTELKQLQHPLSEPISEQQGGIDSLVTDRMSLVRTCTPRDTLILSSPHDDWDNLAIESIVNETNGFTSTDTDDYDAKEIGLTKFRAIPDARPLRRFRSLPTKWNSKTSKTQSCSNDLILHDATDNRGKEGKTIHARIRSAPNVGKVDHVIEPILKKQRSWPLLSSPPTSSPSTHVRFNEIMEVRYFYRSEDEIEIMKQCAIERRMQLELRRRLRRRLRKGESLLMPSAQRTFGFAPNDVVNSFLSFFGSSWNPVEQKAEHDTSGEDMYYDVPDGSIVNCGVQFACYDGDNDDGSDACNEKVVLNDKTTTICKHKKSWLERFAFAEPTLPGLTSTKPEYSNTPTPSTDTSDIFFHHLTDGISSIKFDDAIDNRLTTKKDSLTTTLDPLTGTPTTSSKYEKEEISDEPSETTEPLWFVTALTCGNSSKLPV